MLECKFYFREEGGTWENKGSVSAWKLYWSADSLSLQYGATYEWRIDIYNPTTDETTTGDTWSFSVEEEYEPPPPESENPDLELPPAGEPVWGWDAVEGEYTWITSPSVIAAGGGRYKTQLVVVGHQSIYYS